MDDDSIKDGPFSNAEERQAIRASRIKADKMWVLIGPFVAVFENRKAIMVVLTAIGAITVWMRPDLVAALKDIWMGTGK